MKYLLLFLLLIPSASAKEDDFVKLPRLTIAQIEQAMNQLQNEVKQSNMEAKYWQKKYIDLRQCIWDQRSTDDVISNCLGAT